MKKHLFLHLTKPVILLFKTFDFLSYTVLMGSLFTTELPFDRHSGKKLPFKKSPATNYSMGLFETWISKEISKIFSFEVRSLSVTTTDYNGYGYN